MSREMRASDVRFHLAVAESEYEGARARLRQPWIGHPREAEFEASFAQHMREQEACICEWDGGYGDDGDECRRSPKRGCPTHAQEDSENDAFDDLIDDAMIEIESRPIDQTIVACTPGEKP
jgi:hypothetical protein